VLKDPVVVDLGVEVVAGRDEPGFFPFDDGGQRVHFQVTDSSFKLEQSVLVGAYAGVMVPLLVRERPLLWFTSSLGLGAWIGDDEDGTGIFTLSLAAGIAYAATDMIELRAEVLGFQVRRYAFEHKTCDLAVSLCDAPSNFTDAGELEIWAGFWSPTIAMNLRF
jgi:hypothetical protein